MKKVLFWGLTIFLSSIFISSCSMSGSSSACWSYNDLGRVRFEDKGAEEKWGNLNSEEGPITRPDTIDISNEEYDEIVENPFTSPSEIPTSTFSIDVDNAAYSNVRRFINQKTNPPRNSVRIEEMINYFNYDYPQPTDEHPFSINMEMGPCPWNEDNQLVHIGLQGKDLDYNDLKTSNLVFLLDVSGSMSNENKLPLLKESLKLLVNELGAQDRVAIVVYAGAAGLVLPSTPASDTGKIFRALDELKSGGSTAGGAGINLAYKIAKENLIADGNNRVILATDGDFNVGTTANKSLVELIEEKRKDNIYLTICGLGMGNYKDGRMEQISNAGNGNYFYIDSKAEAEKIFVRDMRANMFTLAKDVKIQIDFDSTQVKAYRLIGYENRMLKKEDFDDDSKDAGELGAGHTVTAIYEIIPNNDPKVIRTSGNDSQEKILDIKFRYKPPTSDESILMSSQLIKPSNSQLSKNSDNFRFSAAVAGFGLLLRDSQYKGKASMDMILGLAQAAKGTDANGYRTEFLGLVNEAKQLPPRPKKEN